MFNDSYAAVTAANAFYPWSHKTSLFCKCASCASFRQKHILAKCARIDDALKTLNDDTLEWTTPAGELPPQPECLTPTRFMRRVPINE